MAKNNRQLNEIISPSDANVWDKASDDATNALTTANNAIPKTEKGDASGVATLGTDGKVPSGQLPSLNYDPAGSSATVQTNLNTHAANTGLHVTAAKQTAWDAKEGPIKDADAKTTPVDADTMPLSDSAASSATKKITWANIKAALKTYFDTLYSLTGHDHTSITGSAAKLTTPRTIDGVEFDGSAAITHYGACTTAAGTAAKTVAVTGFKLVTGARVIVKFSNANTAASPTLNVNSTGAYAMYYKGVQITSSAPYLLANGVYEFVYDGTYYQLVSDDSKAPLSHTHVASEVGAATVTTYTATITTTWSGTGPYTQTVSISGVTAAMTPIIDVVLSDTAATAKLQLEAWGCVNRIVTNNGSITAYCYEDKPVTAIPIQLKVVA